VAGCLLSLVEAVRDGTEPTYRAYQRALTKAIREGRLYLPIYFISLRGHDEIIIMEAFDHVSPSNEVHIASNHKTQLLLLADCKLQTKSAREGGVLLNRLKQLIRLGSHNEIIPMQAFNDMRPPIDGYTPIFCGYKGMMAFLFSNRTDLVSKF
jgi:hypothetical protein